jgi:hypothetical protein
MATSNTAYAAAGYCVAPGAPIQTDGLALSQATFQGSNSDQCYGLYGFDGTITTTEVQSKFDTVAGTPYGTGTFLNVSNGNLLAVTDALTIQFVLAPAAGGSSGSWSITFSDAAGAPATTTPKVFDIVLALKDSSATPDNWALYLFNDESVPVVIGGDYTGVGAWDYPGTENIESSRLFIRNGTPGGAGTGSATAVVPEPASLLLLGTGLSAAAWRARRRKSSK